MKVVYLAKCLMVCVFCSMAAPSMANENMLIVNSEDAVRTRVAQLQNRLDEIKEMDKRALSASEKRMLRREVRDIKKELAVMNGGIYLSVGAIILIALLLILLL